MLKNLNQAGDTIVEVLVAISVIGFLLVGGYATANASYATERQAQERSSALGLLQSQLEQLKSLTSVPSTQPFCMVASSVTYPSSKPSNSGCDFDSSGGNGNSTEPVYHISINGPTNNVFTASAWWYRAGGNGTETMNLQYKLYP